MKRPEDIRFQCSLFTTNIKRTDLGLNPGLRRKKPATNCLSHVTVVIPRTRRFGRATPTSRGKLLPVSIKTKPCYMCSEYLRIVSNCKTHTHNSTLKRSAKYRTINNEVSGVGTSEILVPTYQTIWHYILITFIVFANGTSNFQNSFPYFAAKTVARPVTFMHYLRSFQ
jgi:hypothetical protein